MSEETQNPETEAAGDDWAAAMAEQQQAEAAARAETASDDDGDDVAVAELEPLDEEVSACAGDNMDMILDIPVTLAMEIGRTRISIRNLLQLNQGSVVELDRMAGEPMDVLVNGTLIAHGEVVVVNEKFGIRLTDVISPSERVRKLK